MPPAPPAASPPPRGPPMRRCAPGSPPPSAATSSSATRTPGPAASSPAHSATSDPPGPDQVTIQRSETAAIRPRASVGDTVHVETSQVTALADTKAQDNPRGHVADAEPAPEGGLADQQDRQRGAGVEVVAGEHAH